MGITSESGGIARTFVLLTSVNGDMGAALVLNGQLKSLIMTGILYVVLMTMQQP